MVTNALVEIILEFYCLLLVSFRKPKKMYYSQYYTGKIAMYTCTTYFSNIGSTYCEKIHMFNICSRYVRHILLDRNIFKTYVAILSVYRYIPIELKVNPTNLNREGLYGDPIDL